MIMTKTNNNSGTGRTPYLVRVPSRDQWHIRDGKTRISTGETDRSSATAKLLEYLNKRELQAEAEAARVSAGATLRDLLDRWSAVRQRENMKTWLNKWRYVYNTITSRAGDRRLVDIDDEWAASYERSRYFDDEVSEATVRQELQVVLTAWRLGLESKPKATTLPVPSFDLPPASEIREVFLTRDEAEKLIQSARHDYMRLFIRLGFATGGRHEAILQLEWDRVNLGTGTIDLRNNVINLRSNDIERDERGRRLRGPRQKPRALVRIQGILLDELADARTRAVTDQVIEFRGNPIKKVTKGFRSVVEAAGMGGRGITPHIMRHSAITWLMQAGEDVYKVAGFAGHKDPKMIIQRYGHHHPDYQGGIAKTLAQSK